jgi:hypothetical protein
MYKINICTSQIGSAKLGAEAQCNENDIHRRNTASPFIGSTSVEKSIRQGQLQIKARKGEKTNKYKCS